MKRRGLFLLIHILSLFVIFRLLSLPVSEAIRKKDDLERLGHAAKIAPGNADNYYYAGLNRHYDLLNPDINKAVEYYKTAIEKNPLHFRAWYHLAGAYQSLDQIKDAFSAIDNYYRLNPNSPDRIWNTGVFYLVNSGKMEESTKYFRKYIEIKPGSQSRVYDLYSQMNVSTMYLAGNLLPDMPGLYPAYLKYLVRHNRVDDAVWLYSNVSRRFMDKETRLSLCNLLINNRKYNDALTLWKEIEKENILLSNGGFEKDVKNGCFGWITGRADGVNIFIDRSIYLYGDRSLGVSFDGRHNMNIDIIRRRLLLEPGATYILTANIKTDSLTTTNGLFWEATGHRCSGLRKRSEVVTGTNLWETIGMRFSVPSECRAVNISLRRQRSRKFNNKIKGYAWVDGIEITKIQTGS